MARLSSPRPPRSFPGRPSDSTGIGSATACGSAFRRRPRPASAAWPSFPRSYRKLTGSGFEVLVEKGAGTDASFTDAAYSDAGASLVDDVFGQAEGIVKVQKPSADEAGRCAGATS